MSRPFERNDRRGPAGGRFHKPPRGPAAPEGTVWLWGVHAVEAALANPERTLIRTVATADRARELGARFARRAAQGEVRLETMETGEIARLLPPGAVHGGVAVLADELPPVALEAAADPAHGVILVLDQVTDPQNVGAILRSAAAFGARAVVLQARHSPPLGGALAKAAAGAVDRVPVVHAVNLSRALERLADLGWRTVGLAGDAETPLETAVAGAPVALVLGSEGEGLRRLVAEHCDTLAAIPMPGGFESLNVSAAAAVALYEARRGSGLRAEGERG